RCRYANNRLLARLSPPFRRSVRGRREALRAGTGAAAPYLAPLFPLRRWQSRWSCSSVSLRRIILTQRVAFPVIGHQDAPQVRMAVEANAKKIVIFALV